MFSILIYISLPFVFLFHAIEETVRRQRWARINVDRIGGRHPGLRPMLIYWRNMSNRSFCIIVAEELLLISLAVISAIYGPTQVPLFALIWGFCLHLLVRIGQALAIKGYIPGLITSVILLPYGVVAVSDMIQQFSWQQNLLYAVSGTIIVILNKKLMHMIFKR